MDVIDWEPRKSYIVCVQCCDSIRFDLLSFLDCFFCIALQPRSTHYYCTRENPRPEPQNKCYYHHPKTISSAQFLKERVPIRGAQRGALLVGQAQLLVHGARLVQRLLFCLGKTRTGISRLKSNPTTQTHTRITSIQYRTQPHKPTHALRTRTTSSATLIRAASPFKASPRSTTTRFRVPSSTLSIAETSVLVHGPPTSRPGRTMTKSNSSVAAVE